MPTANILYKPLLVLAYLSTSSGQASENLRGFSAWGLRAKPACRQAGYVITHTTTHSLDRCTSVLPNKKTQDSGLGSSFVLS